MPLTVAIECPKRGDVSDVMMMTFTPRTLCVSARRTERSYKDVYHPTMEDHSRRLECKRHDVCCFLTKGTTAAACYATMASVSATASTTNQHATEGLALHETLREIFGLTKGRGRALGPPMLMAFRC